MSKNAVVIDTSGATSRTFSKAGTVPLRTQWVGVIYKVRASGVSHPTACTCNPDESNANRYAAQKGDCSIAVLQKRAPVLHARFGG